MISGLFFWLMLILVNIMIFIALYGIYPKRREIYMWICPVLSTVVIHFILILWTGEPDIVRGWIWISFPYVLVLSSVVCAVISAIFIRLSKIKKRGKVC